MPRNRVVKVVLSEETAGRVVVAAAFADQTVSEFIRTAIRAHFYESDARRRGAEQKMARDRSIATNE